MQITALVLAAFAGIAAAQSSASSAPASKPSACAAQNIVDACLVTTKNAVTACGNSNDYSCLCQAWTDVTTCYNNCPGHADAFGAQQSKLSFCNAASANPTSKATAATSAATSAGTAAPSTTSGAIRVSGTSSGVSPAATTSNAAALGRDVNGGLAVAALGLMGALVL